MTWPFEADEPVMWVLGGPDGRTPIGEDDPFAWARWNHEHEAERTVGAIELPGPVVVWTVFVGVSFAFGFFFETAVFDFTRCKNNGMPWVDIVERYRTWDEAAAGHARVVEQWQRRQREREAIC